MIPLISPGQMLESERHYFESSRVPSLAVMERAAKAIADIACSRFPEAKRIYFACGPGGNGGDGYACARLLHEKGLDCAIFAPTPPKAGDALENAGRARSLGIEIIENALPESAPDLWVDCLYGTGLSRGPQGAAAALIERMNKNRENGAKILSADIPSGLDGLTGKAHEPCVQADITVTFQLAKCGHFLQDGLDACGEIITADVGFPDEIFPAKLPRMLQSHDLRGLFAPRRRNIHKGGCGHLLIVAGSVGMAGAAALCARAALRSGVGLVSIACPEEIVPILQLQAPCAMCIPLPQENGAICAKALPIIEEALKGKSAAAIGPGLSRRAFPGILRAVLESRLPAVIDADALNLLGENPEIRELLNGKHVLTPHPGEAARLLGRACTAPIDDAKALAKSGATTVLKGAARVICAENETYISAAGGCGMARGGSGDIFTGILGALLAEKSSRSIALSAAAACEIHGKAGELAQEKYGSYAMNSADIIEFLPEVFKRYVD